ncbi:hypothetical protein FIE12Z_8548 [Fusarium flagelliforme]|uniref:Uncharacterized protein n=1 Tax=Fusarium flagelliforme TaxID=2675880 RepID=A0A395MH79_9HYPO|nr:hypothetical protein FIE12Z_8548 [Fusarium flagelliforme]
MHIDHRPAGPATKGTKAGSSHSKKPDHFPATHHKRFIVYPSLESTPKQQKSNMADNPNEAGDRASKESIPLVAEAETITIYKPPKPDDKRQLISSGEAARRVRGKGKINDNGDDKK